MQHCQKPLVAVVDDVPQKLAGASRLIEYLGCRAQVFQRGTDFLADVSLDTACAVLNARMPDLDGPEVNRRMRSKGWSIPVISESGFLSEEEASELYGEGLAAHLNCPWSFAAFEDAIRKGLTAAGYCLPPHGAVVFEPDCLTWNGGIIPHLARSISEEGAFHLLPILGDALEESGCANADALAHCRMPGDHLRGCWVLDRVHALILPDSRFEVIACQSCKRRLRVPNHRGSLAVRCPACGERFDWTRTVSLLFIG
jgi:CheY-like chemotaxis protein